jgi:hypothetical protein
MSYKVEDRLRANPKVASADFMRGEDHVIYSVTFRRGWADMDFDPARPAHSALYNSAREADQGIRRAQACHCESCNEGGAR